MIEAIQSLLVALGVGVVGAIVVAILGFIVVPLLTVGFAWLLLKAWDGFDWLRGHRA